MDSKYTEFTGRTAEEAVEEGLRELGLKREEADIIVLEEGKKKLFGSTKARVQIAPKTSLNGPDEASESENFPATTEDAEEKNVENGSGFAADIHRDAQGRTDGERAVEFIEGLFDILRITASTELVREAEKIEINVTAANTNAVIGKRGAMLDAVQTIAGAVANTGRKEYKRVVVDCENYRENREETLRRLADNLAQKAVRYEKKLKLEPMNPYERRIIHAALSENPDVTTQSEGKEPYRYIVVIPNNVRYPDRPASPVRPEPYKKGNGGYKKQFNRDLNRDGRRPYNGGGREYNRDGYRKPYNKDYNREGRKPYNNDGREYNRDGYRKPYNKDYNRNGGSGSELNGERRDYGSRSSSYKKSSSDFFGTYLGNSKDNKDEE